MTRYLCTYKVNDSMDVSAAGKGLIFRCDTPENRPTYIRLDNGGLCSLRDQINDHLGETQKSLPVGTIVVGKGLTEAQKAHLGEVTEWAKIRDSLSYVSWLRTQEGHVFWATILDRVQNIIASMNAEKKRREVPPRVDVGYFSVKANGSGVNLTCDPYQNQTLSASQARELAGALLRHATAAEKKSSQG